MEVRMAEHMGMCFGVRDAIDLALRLTQQGPLTILGELVHNPDVVADIDAAGARRAALPQEVETRSVLLTAHGTSNQVKLQLRERGLQLHDAVCPLVKRAHQALDRLVADGRHPVVIGQPGHVEVRGLVGDLSDYTIILNEDDFDQLQGNRPVRLQPISCTEAVRQPGARQFQLRFQHMRCAAQHACAHTAVEKFGIGLDVVDQRIELRGAVRQQGAALDGGHACGPGT